MGDAAGAADEGPPCRVRIERPFWISKTIITNEQFNLFDPAHDSRYLDRGGKDHSNRGTPLNQPEQPVVRVSWERADGVLRLALRADRPPLRPADRGPMGVRLPRRGPAEQAAAAASGASTPCPATSPSGPARLSPLPLRADDGRDDELRARPQGRPRRQTRSVCPQRAATRTA